MDLNDYLDQQLQWSEDETTDMKKTCQSKGRLAINAIHNMPKHEPVSILQTGRNIGYAFLTSLKRLFQCV